MTSSVTRAPQIQYFYSGNALWQLEAKSFCGLKNSLWVIRNLRKHSCEYWAV